MKGTGRRVAVMGVEEVRRFIEERGLSAKLMVFDEVVGSVKGACKATGAPPSTIVKTLIAVVDGIPVAVLVPGDRRLSYRKLRRVLGAKRARLASGDEVVRYTGFRPGEVSPLSEPITRLRVVVDERVTRLSRVIAGGGSLNALVEVDVSELLKLLNPLVADVSD